MGKKKQKICCDVCECKHNDENECLCTLDEIKVECACDDAECCEDTICRSFEVKDND